MVKALLAESNVTAVVGVRVEPVFLPQGSALPAVVVSQVSDQDELLLQGQAQYPIARFVVDAVAESFAAADSLGDEVKSALSDWRGEAAGREAIILSDDLDSFDRGEAGDLWRRRMGFRARYR